MKKVVFSVLPNKQPFSPKIIFHKLTTYLRTFPSHCSNLHIKPSYNPWKSYIWTIFIGCTSLLDYLGHIYWLSLRLHLLTYPPIHILITYYNLANHLPTYFIVLQWCAKINMWNKKIDKSWTPFDGVVHWLRIWFIIEEVKGWIINSCNLCTCLEG